MSTGGLEPQLRSKASLPLPLLLRLPRLLLPPSPALLLLLPPTCEGGVEEKPSLMETLAVRRSSR